MPQAYELVLKAVEASRRADASGFLQAIELAEQAARIDPEYAEAWALLGSYCHGMTDAGFDPDPKWFVRTDEALARARALDPENGPMLFATAALHLTRGAKRDAYAGLIAAQRRTPNDPFVYHYFCYLFRLCDMLDDALAASRRGTEIDPSTPWMYWTRIRILAMMGRLREAREEFEITQARFPSMRRGRSSEIVLLTYEGRYQDVIDVAREVAPEDYAGFMAGDTALSLIRMGRASEAASLIERSERFASVDMDQAAFMGCLRAHLGEPDAAFRHLARATALGHDTLTLYTNPIFFGPLFQDPRWELFLEGVRGRVAQWKRDFRWPPA